MIYPPGRQPTRAEHLLLAPLIPKPFPEAQTFIHHITEDTPRRLQLEIEQRYRNLVWFQRVTL